MYRLFVIFLLAALVACTHKPTIQSHYYGFENGSWEKNTPLEFVFEINDTSQQFTLDAGLRYNNDFTFSAMNISVSLISPSGSSRYKGLAFDLKNNDGTLKGDRKDDYIVITVPVYRGLKFNETGKWTISVMHKMPVDITRGLKGIEFELYPVD